MPAAGPSRHAAALASLAPEERGLVETITYQVVAKLPHEPTLELRRLSPCGDGLKVICERDSSDVASGYRRAGAGLHGRRRCSSV
jgi:hypothetical protein